MTQPTATHIYIVGFSDGIVKVGRTANPPQRMRTLKSTAKKTGATLDFGWVSESPDARRAEWSMRVIGRSRFLHIPHSTEYFRADYDTFLRTVLSILDKWGNHPMPVGMARLPDRPNPNPPESYDDEAVAA